MASLCPREFHYCYLLLLFQFILVLQLLLLVLMRTRALLLLPIYSETLGENAGIFNRRLKILRPAVWVERPATRCLLMSVGLTAWRNDKRWPLPRRHGPTVAPLWPYRGGAASRLFDTEASIYGRGFAEPLHTARHRPPTAVHYPASPCHNQLHPAPA